MMNVKNNLVNFFKKVFPSPGNSVLFLTAVLLNLGLWVFISFIPKNNPENMPLHYNIYRGIDIFDSWTKIYVIPIFGAFLVLLDYILAVIIFQKDKLIAYFLNAASILICLILLTAVFWVNYLQNELIK